MIRGIIYKYTSPSGKVYIGQTINEKDRRKHFLIQKLSYGGIKIDTARAKYNPENFKYEILETRFYMTKKAAAKELDILESYYIGLYDSYKYGYNMTLGGGTTTGLKFTEEQKEKCRKRMLEHNPFKGKRHTQQTKNTISNTNSIPVIQIDPITNEVIKEFKSAREAARSFGKERSNSEIVKVCKGYISPSGKHYNTALGFKWKYKESSTTISKESSTK